MKGRGVSAGYFSSVVIKEGKKMRGGDGSNHRSREAALNVFSGVSFPPD